MTGPSHRMFRLVTGRNTPDTESPEHPTHPAPSEHRGHREHARTWGPRIVAEPWTGAGPRSGAGSRPDVAGTTVRNTPDALREAVERAVTGAPEPAAARLNARWAEVRDLTEPADLARLADHVTALTDAAVSVRRQHTETAEDLGPLWDTWAGPAAEAVQDRVSALARSAQALVTELESTADRLADAHDRILAALEDLASSVADEPDGTEAACEHARDSCRQAWDDARRVLAGTVSPPSGPPCP